MVRMDGLPTSEPPAASVANTLKAELAVAGAVTWNTNVVPLADGVS